MDNDFPRCRAVLSLEDSTVFASLLTEPDASRRAKRLVEAACDGRLPPFLPNLVELEQTVARVKAAPPLPAAVSHLSMNPTLDLLAVAWDGLDRLWHEPESSCQAATESIYLMVWRQPESGQVEVRQAEAVHLLALKVLAEGLAPEQVAQAEGCPIGVVDAAIQQAVALGLLLAPLTAICRPAWMAAEEGIDPKYLRPEVFTLQWHITQACDLHCKHCYDRSSRQVMPLEQGFKILDDLRHFCRSRFIQGQVSFSGGNPLLYPHFMELYQGAVERYLGVAILGNPAPRRQMEAICAIAKPLFYQVSLEGLEAHNDYIRGPGHFGRVLEFLDLLSDLGIYSMVMLTLTRDNQGQVLDLAERLRDKVDLFTFNRLAMVGEGASLSGPEVESYQKFLHDYRQAAQDNPCMGLKDNLFNLLALSQAGGQLFGGCAGHGCGAAFNFVSLLADGEVHACRKFPSPIGNAFTTDFEAIYEGQTAESYRQGSAACRGCRLRPLCGGCLAVVHGMGLDPLADRDPYCWL